MFLWFLVFLLMVGIAAGQYMKRHNPEAYQAGVEANKKMARSMGEVAFTLLGKLLKK